MHIIGRAGASPPSRATGLNFLTHSVYTYRIVLNVSTRFYFSVYATISLAPRASCCLCRGQLPSIMPSISVTVNSDNTSSTTHRSLCLNGINSCCVSSPHATTTLCFSTVNHVYTTFCGTFLYSSVYTSTCRFAERAVLRFFRDRFTLCVHHYTEPVAH